MKSRLMLTVLAVFTAAIIDAQVANAATKYFDRGNGTDSWNAAANWDATGCNAGGATGIPSSGDEVVICPSVTCQYDVGTLAIDTLDIREGAELTFTGTPVLTIGGGSVPDALRVRGREDLAGIQGKLNLNDDAVITLNGGGVHRIDGQVLLANAAAILRVTASARFAGSGEIFGSEAAARLEVDNATLTNEMTIRGEMKITKSTGSGAFVNNGLVYADSSLSGGEEMVLEELTFDLGTGVYLIECLDSSSKMRFGANASCEYMTSPFQLILGTLDFDVIAASSGHFDHFGGTLNCDVQCSFPNYVAR